MYKIEDILIPVRFLLLMLQIIITLTFVISETYEDHIRANFPDYYSEYDAKNKKIQFIIQRLYQMN